MITMFERRSVAPTVTHTPGYTPRRHNLTGLLEVSYRAAPARQPFYGYLDRLRLDSYYARIAAELERPEWND